MDKFITPVECDVYKCTKHLYHKKGCPWTLEELRMANRRQCFGGTGVKKQGVIVGVRYWKHPHR